MRLPKVKHTKARVRKTDLGAGTDGESSKQCGLRQQTDLVDSHSPFLHGATDELNFTHWGRFAYCKRAQSQLPGRMSAHAHGRGAWLPFWELCPLSTVSWLRSRRQDQRCHIHLRFSFLPQSLSFPAFWEPLLGSWEDCSEPACNYHKTTSHLRKEKLKKMEAGLWTMQEMIGNWFWTQNCN